jgi:hypothetical protein
MKKLFYTFFFGYLSLKWRRLFRTLIIIASFVWTLNVYEENTALLWIEGEPRYVLNEVNFTQLTLIPVVLILLISWVIKPFLVKED